VVITVPIPGGPKLGAPKTIPPPNCIPGPTENGINYNSSLYLMYLYIKHQLILGKIFKYG